MSDKEPISTHQECPDCGSKDCLSIYEDHTYCFSCEKHTWINQSIYVKEENTMEENVGDIPSGWFKLVPTSIPDRGISEETSKKYNVRTYSKNGRIIKHAYPYYSAETGEFVAVKTRVVASKDFLMKGKETKISRLALFGSQAFPSGNGKRILLVEGELDALAAYQMLSKWKVPVVSVPSGATSGIKALKNPKNYEYLTSFEEIYLCFDNDEAGQNASRKLAGVLPARKTKIVKLDKDIGKDACDFLLKKSAGAFIDSFWKAEMYTPEGIVNAADLWEEVKKPLNVECVPYPWEELNEKTYGIREKELVVLTAGSGMGKTQFLREIIVHLLNTTESSIGCLFLEESNRTTVEGLMSVACNKPLHLPTTVADDKEREEAFEATVGTGRVYLYDHFGSTEIDSILNKISFMAKVLGCKYIFFDHISIVVSDQRNGDERRSLDEISTKIKTLTMDLDCAIFMVAHTKRQNTKSHEEGGQTSLSDLRGTAAIGQLSNIVLGLERDGQNKDPIKRNTTCVRVLKNRFSGDTGASCYLFYDKNTGRLTRVDPPEEPEEGSEFSDEDFKDL